MANEQRDIDREAELARQETVLVAVDGRNRQIILGANPDPNVGSGFYPENEVEVQALDRMAKARAAKKAKAEARR
jgi:hypothetical protein